MRKVFSKGAVFKLTIDNLLVDAVTANHLWPVPLIYSELNASLYALRKEESLHTSKPLLPLALRESTLAVLRWVAPQD
jgi:hypothetical protein